MILRHIFLAFILLLSLSTLYSYECFHDTYKITYKTYPNHDSSSIYVSNSTTRESIRITPVSYISTAPSNVLTMVQDDLIPAVIAYYHATLKIKRLLEPIKLVNDDTRSCASVTSTTALRAGIYTDLVILITGKYDYTNQYVAYGYPCYGDATTHRPIVGVLAINYAFGFDKDTDYNYQQNLYIMLHQFAHILGFSDTLFPYFVNPDTNKRLSSPSKTKNVNGVKIKMLTLEPLTEKLQDYFKCPSLKGAYLEQQGDSKNIGSHFERRIFMNDMMTASTITDMRISEFLLAFFEGTGWYTPDYKRAEPMSWGKGQGCDFLDTPCIDSKGETSFPDFFCTNTGEDGCSYTNGGYAICGTNDMTVTDSSLNSNFDYFGGKVVMRDRFADNCPYYVNYLDGDCTDTSNEDINLEGSEYFGTKGSCFTGTLGENKAKSKTSSYCFKKTCKSIGYGEYKVIITVGDETVTCYKAGTVSVSGFKGKINCPDPTTFCKVSSGTYCPRGCLGRGDCIQTTCYCYDGYDGVDCSNINPNATYPVTITATSESTSPNVVLIVVPIIGVSGLGVGFGYVLYRIAKRRRSLKVTPMNEKKPKKQDAAQTESALEAPSLGHQSSLAPLNMNGSVLSGTTMTGSQLTPSRQNISILISLEFLFIIFSFSLRTKIRDPLFSSFQISSKRGALQNPFWNK